MSTNPTEIALLIQAYIARTSMLQSRLLSTSDSLDVLQRTHQEELLSITNERDQLKVKLHRYIDFVKSIKSDHEDLRDAVMKLIEKVEISNNYTEWPQSQLFLSSLVDPSFKEKEVVANHHHHPHLYAASLIEALRKQRDSERSAHTRTRALADAQLAELNAKLSRRDAELECCIAGAEHIRSVREADLTTSIDGSRRTWESEQVHDDPISRNEIVSLLDLAAARNKILEAEVKILVKQLEEAQSAQRQKSSSSSSTPTTTSQRDNGVQPVHSNHNVIGDSVDPSTIQLFANQIDTLGLKIDAFAAERKAVVESLEGTRPLEVRKSYLNTETAGTHVLISPCSPAGGGKNQLYLRLQHVERECDRLRRRETELREQLNDTRTDAEEKEVRLLGEIRALRQKLQGRMAPSNFVEVGVETEAPPANPENLLEPNEGEQSMELATPLLPTIALISVDIPSPRNEFPSSSSRDIQQEHYHSDSASEIESPYIDPPTIPLPHSPETEIEGLSAWEENSPSDFTISASDFPIPPGFSSLHPSSNTKMG